jgi:hypothetical protein
MQPRRPVMPILLTALALVVTVAGCDPAATDPGDGGRPPRHSARAATSPSLADPCGRWATTPPATYQHVIVIVEENRTWSGGASPAVGLGFSATKMPFLHSLAARCSYFSRWNETDAAQNSLNQYIGMTSGVANTHTVNDCNPSATCRSTDNNIFRQVRAAGGVPRSYVDGATRTCSAAGNAAKHVPALYFKGGTDASYCATEVRPFTSLNPDALPTFALVSPNLCHDGHDCSDTTVDAWAKTLLTRLLNGSNYRSGNTLVVLTYDEDRPVPNLLIAPTAHKGVINSVIGSHASLLKTVELALGLPVMSQGQLPTATNLRTIAHL